MQPLIDVPSPAQELLLLMMYQDAFTKSGDENCLYRIKCLAATSAYESTRREALEILCRHIQEQAAELKRLRTQ